MCRVEVAQVVQGDDICHAVAYGNCRVTFGTSTVEIMLTF